MELTDKQIQKNKITRINRIKKQEEMLDSLDLQGLKELMNKEGLHRKAYLKYKDLLFKQKFNG